MPRNEKRLDAFTNAYIEAMLWSTNDESDERGGEPLDKNYSATDISDETMQLIVDDCADFQKRFGHLIEDDESPEIQKWGRDELSGHDFWLTRVGSGAGFNDGGWPKHGDELAKAAKSYGGFDLYVGDDGLIYGPPADWYRSHRRTGGVAEVVPRPHRVHGRYPKPSQPSPRFIQPRVRDFNTRQDLIDHARGEGATHVVVVGSGATLYFPTRGGQYEEARAWRQNGYWHVPAAGARKVVDRLPAGAEPIGAGRRAAESTVGSRNFIAVEFDLRRGERTGNQMTFMANDLKDAAAKCAYTLNLKSSGWKVSPSGRTVQHKTGDIGWHIVEAGSPAARNMGVSETVRDYVPVDHRGRPLSGPTKDYGEAKSKADQAGGVVKFTTGRPQDMGEARGTRWSDWEILDSIDRGQMVSPEAEARAVKLAQLGFIDTTGTWRLTAKGRRVVDQRVPVAAEAPRRRGQSQAAKPSDPLVSYARDDIVIQLSDKLSKKVGGGPPRLIDRGFRWSEPNVSAQFTTYSPEHGQPIVVVVSIFEDGSTALNFFSDESLSGTATYENVGHFAYAGANIQEMVQDIDWVKKIVDGYAASWQQPGADVDESRRPHARRGTRRTPQPPRRRRPARRR